MSQNSNLNSSFKVFCVLPNSTKFFFVVVVSDIKISFMYKDEKRREIKKLRNGLSYRLTCVFYFFFKEKSFFCLYNYISNVTFLLALFWSLNNNNNATFFIRKKGIFLKVYTELKKPTTHILYFSWFSLIQFLSCVEMKLSWHTLRFYFLLPLL